MLLFHPSEARLNQFADGELGVGRRARVARHLLRCEHCRGSVNAIRLLARDARDLPLPSLGVSVRSRVLSSLQAGAQVIVPVADPARRAWLWPRVLQAGAGVLAVAVVLALVIEPRALRSEASSLEFEPQHPVAGSQVDVTYRATARLARHDRLRLRALYRRADDPQVRRDATREVAAWLERDADGLFRGTFSLPPGAVYGLFAVEDDSGRVVDGRGRTDWEFLAAQDRRPSYDALLQKSYEASGGDIRVALDAAVEATEVNPQRVEAWLARGVFEQLAFGDVAYDSLRAFHWDQLRRLDAELRDQSVSPVIAGSMYFYAWTWGEDRITETWQDWILRETPRTPIGSQVRAAALIMADVDAPGNALDDLERLWQETPSPHVTLPQNAFRTALHAGRVEAARVWAERWLSLEPWQRRNIAEDLLMLPSLTDYALMLLAAELESLRSSYDEGKRSLYETVREYDARSGRARREILGLMGRALLLRGDANAARTYLDSATVEGWNAGFFEDLAEARLATGDAVGSAEMLSRLTVDPARSADVTARALRLVDSTSWRGMLAQARQRMIVATLAEAQPRALEHPVELLDHHGDTHDLHDLVRGQITIVAFLWPPCVTCLDDLAALQAARHHVQSPFRVILITEERPSEEAVGRLRARGLDFPLMTDAKGQAAIALESWGTAGYFVLDPRGMVQFPNTTLEDVPRQVEALAHTPPVAF